MLKYLLQTGRVCLLSFSGIVSVAAAAAAIVQGYIVDIIVDIVCECVCVWP